MLPLRWFPAVLAASVLFAQIGTEKGEWRFYAGDERSTRYSPLDQITAANAKQLQIAWRWRAANFGPRPQTTWEVTPLMVGGKLYFTAGERRAVVAADALTGETLWTLRFDDVKDRGMVRANNRGLAYWSDGSEERLTVISPGYQLYQVNAKTGERLMSFGTGGAVDLWKGLDRDVIKPGTIGATSPAMIIKDVIVVGMAAGVGVALPTKNNPPGYIRGFDVRSGRLLWTFKTVPRLGEFGNNTWESDSWQFTGNTGAWGPLTADDELGYVYIPTEMPSGDLYGGQRPGDNLFSDSVVALDVKTGRRIWHYQVIHHDVWDFDLPCAPVLLDITVNGRRIKALAQPSKQAFLYVFDRTNGQPVWPIEERPVPQSGVPGEKTAKTQPFPTKPAAYDLQGSRVEDLIDFTPEIRAEAIKSMEKVLMGPLYTPPIVKGAGGKDGMMQQLGGSNWQGASADPETGMIYLPSVTSPYLSSLISDPVRSEMPFIAGGALGAMPRPFGLPPFKPPYGRITAIDLNTGDHAWMIPNGETPAAVKNNPALKGIDTSKFGGSERTPILVTKTLLFSGGASFRALDKKTGAVVHDMKLPANSTGGPMTYMINGRQFIVVATGGRDGAELVALTLPQPGAAPARPAQAE